MAKRLFEQLFLSATINGESNPYYHYFNSGLSENPSDSTHINHGLVMMFFAFLGPHLFTGYDDYFDHASVLIRRFTHQHYHQALSDSRLSDNIGEYNTPEHFANQLIAAGLDAETALLITLCALAHASYFCMNINDVSWQETLEELLKRFVPSHFILVAYNNMNILCTGSSGTVPDSIFYSMNEFTENLMGIEIQNSLSRKKPKAANLTDASTQYSDSDWRSKFEDHNEEIEQEAGAVGGATEESHECKVCSGSPPYKAIIENVRSLDICENCCRKMGICETCIERAFKE
ncbi:hypothetical protein [Endozoicomonas sp. 4G]|uniref:hypothetical protein n=1 Tax=Endozoicomonas sp. 4G TaxID=2872754 RepID=UPI0020786FC9|nr:hypothetical protein [Endozoicomonas sp. 4G]